MKTQAGVRVFAALLIGTLGCEAQVEREAVESQSEALNFEPDFEVGVVAVKYVNGRPMKSTDTWTQSLSTGTNTSGITTFQQGYLDPDGPRVGLANVGAGTLLTMATDFRLTMRAWNVPNAATIGGSTTFSATSWASEGGLGDPSAALFSNDTIGTDALDRYQIGIETRPWPASVTQTLVNFRIRLAICYLETTFGPIEFCGDWQSTAWAKDIATGTTSWSFTAVPRAGTEHRFSGPQLVVDTVLVDKP